MKRRGVPRLSSQGASQSASSSSQTKSHVDTDSSLQSTNEPLTISLPGRPLKPLTPAVKRPPVKLMTITNLQPQPIPPPPRVDWSMKRLPSRGILEALVCPESYNATKVGRDVMSTTATSSFSNVLQLSSVATAPSGRASGQTKAPAHNLSNTDTQLNSLISLLPPQPGMEVSGTTSTPASVSTLPVPPPSSSASSASSASSSSSSFSSSQFEDPDGLPLLPPSIRASTHAWVSVLEAASQYYHISDKQLVVRASAKALQESIGVKADPLKAPQPPMPPAKSPTHIPEPLATPEAAPASPAETDAPAAVVPVDVTKGFASASAASLALMYSPSTPGSLFAPAAGLDGAAADGTGSPNIASTGTCTGTGSNWLGAAPLRDVCQVLAPAAPTTAGLSLWAQLQLLCAVADAHAPGYCLWEHISPQGKDGVPRVNERGKYIVRLWLHGEWRAVTVDDRVPVDVHGQSLFPMSAVQGELWPLLLCKAYVKACRGVEYAHEQLHMVQALTGWAPLACETSLTTACANLTALGDVSDVTAAALSESSAAPAPGVEERRAAMASATGALLDTWLASLTYSESAAMAEPEKPDAREGREGREGKEAMLANSPSTTLPAVCAVAHSDQWLVPPDVVSALAQVRGTADSLTASPSGLLRSTAVDPAEGGFTYVLTLPHDCLLTHADARLFDALTGITGPPVARGRPGSGTAGSRAREGREKRQSIMVTRPSMSPDSGAAHANNLLSLAAAAAGGAGMGAGAGKALSGPEAVRQALSSPLCCDLREVVRYLCSEDCKVLVTEVKSRCTFAVSAMEVEAMFPGLTLLASPGAHRFQFKAVEMCSDVRKPHTPCPFLWLTVPALPAPTPVHFALDCVPPAVPTLANILSTHAAGATAGAVGTGTGAGAGSLAVLAFGEVLQRATPDTVGFSVDRFDYYSHTSEQLAGYMWPLHSHVTQLHTLQRLQERAGPEGVWDDGEAGDAGALLLDGDAYAAASHRAAHTVVFPASSTPTLYRVRVRAPYGYVLQLFAHAGAGTHLLPTQTRRVLALHNATLRMCGLRLQALWLLSKQVEAGITAYQQALAPAASVAAVADRLEREREREKEKEMKPETVPPVRAVGTSAREDADGSIMLRRHLRELFATPTMFPGPLSVDAEQLTHVLVADEWPESTLASPIPAQTLPEGFAERVPVHLHTLVARHPALSTAVDALTTTCTAGVSVAVANGAAVLQPVVGTIGAGTGNFTSPVPVPGNIYCTAMDALTTAYYRDTRSQDMRNLFMARPKSPQAASPLLAAPPAGSPTAAHARLNAIRQRPSSSSVSTVPPSGDRNAASPVPPARPASPLEQRQRVISTFNAFLPYIARILAGKHHRALHRFTVAPLPAVPIPPVIFARLAAAAAVEAGDMPTLTVPFPSLASDAVDFIVCEHPFKGPGQSLTAYLSSLCFPPPPPADCRPSVSADLSALRILASERPPARPPTSALPRVTTGVLARLPSDNTSSSSSLPSRLDSSRATSSLSPTTPTTAEAPARPVVSVRTIGGAYSPQRAYNWFPLFRYWFEVPHVPASLPHTTASGTGLPISLGVSPVDAASVDLTSGKAVTVVVDGHPVKLHARPDEPPITLADDAGASPTPGDKTSSSASPPPTTPTAAAAGLAGPALTAQQQQQQVFQAHLGGFAAELTRAVVSTRAATLAQSPCYLYVSLYVHCPVAAAGTSLHIIDLDTGEAIPLTPSAAPTRSPCLLDCRPVALRPNVLGYSLFASAIVRDSTLPSAAPYSAQPLPAGRWALRVASSALAPLTEFRQWLPMVDAKPGTSSGQRLSGLALTAATQTATAASVPAYTGGPVPAGFAPWAAATALVGTAKAPAAGASKSERDVASVAEFTGVYTPSFARTLCSTLLTTTAPLLTPLSLQVCANVFEEPLLTHAHAGCAAFLSGVGATAQESLLPELVESLSGPAHPTATTAPTHAIAGRVEAAVDAASASAADDAGAPLRQRYLSLLTAWGAYYYGAGFSLDAFMAGGVTCTCCAQALADKSFFRHPALTGADVHATFTGSAPCVCYDLYLAACTLVHPTSALVPAFTVSVYSLDDLALGEYIYKHPPQPLVTRAGLTGVLIPEVYISKDVRLTMRATLLPHCLVHHLSSALHRLTANHPPSTAVIPAPAPKAAHVAPTLLQAVQAAALVAEPSASDASSPAASPVVAPASLATAAAAVPPMEPLAFSGAYSAAARVPVPVVTNSRQPQAAQLPYPGSSPVPSLEESLQLRWHVRVIGNAPVVLCSEHSQEDEFVALKLAWEKAQPGRAKRARALREKLDTEGVFNGLLTGPDAAGQFLKNEALPVASIRSACGSVRCVPDMVPVARFTHPCSSFVPAVLARTTAHPSVFVSARADDTQCLPPLVHSDWHVLGGDAALVEDAFGDATAVAVMDNGAPKTPWTSVGAIIEAAVSAIVTGVLTPGQAVMWARTQHTNTFGADTPLPAELRELAWLQRAQSVLALAMPMSTLLARYLSLYSFHGYAAHVHQWRASHARHHAMSITQIATVQGYRAKQLALVRGLQQALLVPVVEGAKETSHRGKPKRNIPSHLNTSAYIEAVLAALDAVLSAVAPDADDMVDAMIAAVNDTPPEVSTEPSRRDRDKDKDKEKDREKDGSEEEEQVKLPMWMAAPVVRVAVNRIREVAVMGLCAAVCISGENKDMESSALVEADLMMRLNSPALVEEEIFVVRHMAILSPYAITSDKVTYLRTLLNTLAKLPVQMQSRLLHCALTRVQALLNDYYHCSLEVKLQMARDNPKNMRWDELNTLIAHTENEQWRRFATEKQRLLAESAKNALTENNNSKAATTMKKLKRTGK